MDKTTIYILLGMMLVVFLGLYTFFSDRSRQRSDTTDTNTVPYTIVDYRTQRENEERDPSSTGVQPTTPPDFRSNTIFDNAYASAVHYPNGNTYHITILAPPFEQNRLRAEQDFLQSINLTEEQACRLKVVINTPMWVDEEQSGKNFPLSFCSTLVPY